MPCQAHDDFEDSLKAFGRWARRKRSHFEIPTSPAEAEAIQEAKAAIWAEVQRKPKGPSPDPQCMDEDMPMMSTDEFGSGTSDIPKDFFSPLEHDDDNRAED